MRILIVTPAARGSRAGNRTTACRWARILRADGHRVTVTVGYDNAPADLMVALHAWRSADAVQRYRERHPDRPLIVALTGTDLYRFLTTDREITTGSMELADRLVVLHEAAIDTVPEALRSKVRVILQSAEPFSGRKPSTRRFDVCVIGHLRDEKDPLRTAYAVRDLPPQSQLQVLHLGKAHTDDWAQRAQAEMARNPRYRWRGEVPYRNVRQVLARSRLMVLSSRMEGGANVVSEAVVAGVPVIASRIDGSVGLLGPSYPGYYPTEDTAALAGLLLRAERDPAFYASLQRACALRAPLFDPQRERHAWRDMLSGL
ncbi:MAG: selenoneine biosynthesis selenosugar synthase SenB [Acidiferrobacterales bacterium]